MLIVEPVRRVAWPPADARTPEALATREWLVTNGLGGYASGTVAGVITRRYHGLLIAALAAPLGRTVMLSHVAEQLTVAGGRCIEIGGGQRPGGAPAGHGPRHSIQVPPGSGAAGGGLRRRGFGIRERAVPPAP